MGRRYAAASLAHPRLFVSRLERCRGGRLDRAGDRGRVAGRRADRTGRSRGVLRLPVDPADDLPGRGPDAKDRLAREQSDRRPHSRRGPRPRPARWDRAEPSLAHLLGDDRDRRRRPRRRDGDHDGRPDRRGLPHPPGADHRPRLRSAAGPRTRPPALRLRRAHRHRRHRPRLLPAGRDELRIAVGGGSPLRRRGAQPEGRAGFAAPSRGAHRDRRRGLRPGGRDEQLRRADRPRRRLQSGDRGAGREDRGRAGRALRRRREPALRRHHCARVPALPAAARAGEPIRRAQLSADGQIRR
jgi:hypothetical protein